MRMSVDHKQLAQRSGHAYVEPIGAQSSCLSHQLLMMSSKGNCKHTGEQGAATDLALCLTHLI